MLNEIILKMGKYKTILILTVISITASLCISTSIRFLTDAPITSMNIFISIFTPLLIVPPVVTIFMRLLLKIYLLEIEMKNSVSKDELTSLKSKRTYNQQTNALYNLALRNGSNFSIMYLTIDDFQSLDDTFGFGTGKHTLKELAEYLKAETRSGDILGRIDDNKFAFTLPETDCTGAQYLSEKLRRRVEHLGFKYNVNNYSITVSIGITSRPANQDFVLGSLYKGAEEQLMRAIKKGKNRVEFCPKSLRPIVS